MTRPINSNLSQTIFAIVWGIMSHFWFFGFFVCFLILHECFVVSITSSSHPALRGRKRAFRQEEAFRPWFPCLYALMTGEARGWEVNRVLHEWQVLQLLESLQMPPKVRMSNKLESGASAVVWRVGLPPTVPAFHTGCSLECFTSNPAFC